MNERKEMTYVAPEMELVNIEVEQAILSDSFGSTIESLGDRGEDQGW